MSEKLYAFLLRLFPSHFRQSYGEDALQLFRDRARHETGASRLRLWLDLLADLAISVPREYFYAQPELLTAPTDYAPGPPSFYVLNQGAPRPGALVFGFVLSVSALLTFSGLLNQGGQHRILRASASRRSFSSRSATTPARPSPQSGGDDSSFSASGEPPLPANGSTSASAARRDAASSRASTECCAASPQDPPASSTSPTPSNSSSPFVQNAPASALVATPSSSSSFSPKPGTGENSQPNSPQIDASERHHVITTAAAALQQYYAHPDVAKKMSDSLLAHERRGDDNAATDGTTLATLLTHQIREISNDRHLDVAYSSTRLPDQAGQPTPQALAAYRDFLRQNNCTFEKIELLPGNLGYLKLNSFPELSSCQQTAISAMRRLNHASALIFDLRDNRGGEPATVAFFASYLFDHPEYFYNPRENTTSASWTHSPVAGNLLADKPVYILTSSHTYSGAEQFCYDLKMLKRATLVGETTGGAAHAGVFHRLDDHFGIGIPETQPINPYAAPDWAETGVVPDVQVPAADALTTAQKLALAKLQR